MARKTNYSFEKRQRELQKKEKKAAKAEAKKAARLGEEMEPGAEVSEAGDIAPDTPVEADKAE
tara:strand:- start:106188 stop:106376 length:189 start_codon:yes stop_codon:yes gene_type:complete